jgi:uncharacterized membrane protein
MSFTKADRLVLNNILERIKQVAIDQATFDSDLAALVSSITNLIAAVDAKIAATPAADFTAEDATVQQAAASVAAELNKLNPPAPVPTPAPAPTGP